MNTNSKRCFVLNVAIAAVLLVLFLNTSAAFALSDPVTDKDGITTWDCVYFGHYPQSADENGGFKTEPIKWRVLKVDGDDAYLLSDKCIDTMPYCDSPNNPKMDCLWHVSTVRSWLNGYGADENQEKIDYTKDNFISKAFSEEELNAVKTTEVITDKTTDWHFNWTDIHHYYMRTSDKVFLLQYDEATDPKYGFTSDDEPTITRVTLNTAYTAAGGSYGDKYRNKEGEADSWLLRSPGEYSMYADIFTAKGEYEEDISDVNPVNVSQGIRPVLHLDLGKTDVWSEAGKFISRFSQTIKVGANYMKKYGDEPFALNAETTGDSKLEYKSDNDKVASVDVSGKVTINGVGKAVITITAPMTDKYEAATKQVTVTVSKRTYDISCDDVSMLMTDKPFALDVKAEQGAKLTYSIVDPAVAEVSEAGVVTPLSAGETTLNITADEDDTHQKTTVAISVMVKKAKASIKAKKTSMSYKAKKLKKKAQSFLIKASCTSGAKVSCTKKSGHKYLKVSKTGKVTVKKGAKKGSYSIKVLIKAAANDKYEAAKKQVTVKVKVK